jgi:hypothetical protein
MVRGDGSLFLATRKGIRVLGLPMGRHISSSVERARAAEGRRAKAGQQRKPR